MRAVRPLKIPETNTALWLRRWNCAERREFHEEVADSSGCMAWVFVRTVADKRGRRRFTDEDIPEVGRLPYLPVDRVYRAALTHNGITEKDLADREAEFAENYELRFWFLLAGHLKKTVGELQRTMSVDEFRDWLAYSRRHPIGDDLADMHLGMLSRFVLATIPRKRGAKLPSVADLMPDWWKPRKQSEEQIQATFNQFFTAMKNQCQAARERTGERMGA